MCFAALAFSPPFHKNVFVKICLEKFVPVRQWRTGKEEEHSFLVFKRKKTVWERLRGRDGYCSLNPGGFPLCSKFIPPPLIRHCLWIVSEWPLASCGRPATSRRGREKESRMAAAHESHNSCCATSTATGCPPKSPWSEGAGRVTFFHEMGLESLRTRVAPLQERGDVTWKRRNAAGFDGIEASTRLEVLTLGDAGDEQGFPGGARTRAVSAIFLFLLLSILLVGGSSRGLTRVCVSCRVDNGA